jgi:hypothetical protein
MTRSASATISPRAPRSSEIPTSSRSPRDATAWCSAPAVTSRPRWFGCRPLSSHDQRLLRPELARTLLEQGTILRRAKQKNPAKQSLEQALTIFEGIGASLSSALG